MNTNNKGHAANVTPCNLQSNTIDYTGHYEKHAFNPDVAESMFGEVESFESETRLHYQQLGEERPAQASEAWPEPLPIPDSLLPVMPFDFELLPATLRGWVKDVADRMQCPPDFAAVGAMVALSSVIGRKACLAPKRKDDWRTIPNLWGVIVGRPGVMKSPALSEMLKPLDRLAAEANKLHAGEVKEFAVNSKMRELGSKSTETDAAKLIRDGKKDDARRLLLLEADSSDVRPPAKRRYKVVDSTMEALGEVLIENPCGVLAYRDEIHGLLKSLDKEGQEGARSFYLQGADGNQGYTFDRIGRGKDLHIPAVCISLLGGTQPGKLKSYVHDAMSGGSGDDGLLQRFGLLVWPDINAEWKNVDRRPDIAARETAFETFARLDAMTGETDPDTGNLVPKEYRFSPEAQIEFDDWRYQLEMMLRSGDHHSAMESHLSKYRKTVPALALVCGLADRETEISHNSLMRALAWAEYLQSHAMRAYTAGTSVQADGARGLLAKIKAGVLHDGFKPRDVYLKGWSFLTSNDEVQQATALLCDLGYIREKVKPTSEKGGRPSVSFKINPAVIASGGDK